MGCDTPKKPAYMRMWFTSFCSSKAFQACQVAGVGPLHTVRVHCANTTQMRCNP